MFVSNNTQFMSMPLVRAPHVGILRSPLWKKEKKKFARRHAERLGFLYTVIRNTKLRTTQKHDVIYVISKPLAWRVGLTVSVAYRHQSWVSHQSPPNEEVGIQKNLFFFSKIFALPSKRYCRIDSLNSFGNQIFIPFLQCRSEIFAFGQNKQILP